MENKRKKYSDGEKKKIGSRIKKIRLEKGMTLEEFGKLFDTSKSNVSMWEKGRSLPNPERMKQIAKVGDTTVSDLMATNNARILTISKDSSLRKMIYDAVDESIEKDFDDDAISKIILDAFPDKEIDKQAYGDLINTLNDIGNIILPVEEIIQIYQINIGDAQPKIKDRKTLIQSYEKYLEGVEMFRTVPEFPEVLNFIEARERSVKIILKHLKSK
ncbi:helix-turn-helix domain-containing protein [Peptostreptococcus stomatis]|uniref:helix-turn-helix domain-containing protein n=1 Tax=Peptostreptococcus stomatis TaxID=341694 RepID=UPI0028EB1298|nr:helix-turn-helix domain-containing protein [Peptostreptococcus stomatis]